MPNDQDKDMGQGERLVVCNLFDVQKLAKTKISKALYEYLASGTDCEQTLAENRSAFKNYYLRPRVMRPIQAKVDTSVELFGHGLKIPIFVSPAGVHCLCDPDGECATAKACGRVGALFGLSQHSTKSIEDVAAAAPMTLRWYQSYILKDRDRTLRLVRRAVKEGYTGIFLTVDSVRFGFREADKRNGFNALPPPHKLVNYEDGEDGKKYRNADLSACVASKSSTLEAMYNSKQHEAWDQNIEAIFDTQCTWDDVKWLKRNGCPNLPLVIKGIMTAEDALAAVNAGADGIMVSNHGGRQLDGCLASIDALPEVVNALKGLNVPILLDGGIMRGSDVLKALALGATAVGVGKPIFFSLVVGGEQGVVNMFNMLRTELESAMALCGCQSIQDITSSLICRHPYFGSSRTYVRSSL